MWWVLRQQASPDRITPIVTVPGPGEDQRTEQERISAGVTISGRAIQVGERSLIIAVVGYVVPRVEAVITPETKFYRLSNDEIPKKVPISFRDIPSGAFLTIAAGVSIGTTTTIIAEEVVKISTE